MRYDLQVYRYNGGSLYEDGWIPAEDLLYPPLLLERLSAIGAIELKTGMLSCRDAVKVEKILRLRRSLGVNLSGAAIIAELMDRLEAMELQIERRNMRDPPGFIEDG